MKRSLLLTLFAIPATLMAQQIAPSEAIQKARTFLKSSNSTTKMRKVATASGSQVTLAYTANKGSENQFYVFNNGIDGGFVIIGADERAKEILGYSETSSFNYDSIPDNMKWWLSQYQEQIHNAIANGSTPLQTQDEQNSSTEISDENTSEAKVRRAPTNRSNITPLLKTTWGQGSPFNTAIPLLNGSRPVTGCVATAAAQIMNYWQYPAIGTGSHSYTSSESSTTYSANFGNTEYDWDNMLNTYNTSSTQKQKDAVATLMYHIGVGVEMNYGAKSSGSNSFSLATALYNYFRYSHGSLNLHSRDYYWDDDWESLVYNELSAKRPVYYGGYSRTAGHAFVCDGYRVSDNTFHINWGWNGMYNGYFPLSGTLALTPDGTGTGGGTAGSGYVNGQEILTWFTPQPHTVNNEIMLKVFNDAKGGVLVSRTSDDAEPTPALSLVTRRNDRITLSNMYITTTATMDFTPYEMALACTDENGNTYYAEQYSTQTFKCDMLYGSYSYLLPSTIPNGTYSVTPVYKTQGNLPWKKVHIAPNVKAMPTLYVHNPSSTPVAKCTAFKRTSTSTTTTTPNKVSLSFTTTSAHKSSEVYVSFKLVHGDHEYYSPNYVGWKISAGAGRVISNQELEVKLLFSNGGTPVNFNGTYELIPVCRDDTYSAWTPMTMDGIKPLSITIKDLDRDVCDYTLGDINADNQINISDVTGLVNIILGKSSETPASDVNQDGTTNISDVTTLVNQILGK